MKLALAFVLAAAACGGSKPAPTPPPAPEPVAAPEPAPEPAPPPAPEPPPPATPVGWFASADYSVAFVEGGAATVELRGKKPGKAKMGTWDVEAKTLTVDKKATPFVLDGDNLTVTVGGKEYKLVRQPATFVGTYANDNGSIQLNEDGTCVHGVGGIPAKCTYKLENGKLAVTYDKETKKKAVTWLVWFDQGGKVLNTPKEQFTSTAQ